MAQEQGASVEISFDSHGLGVDEVGHRAADMWADLAFDGEALAILKRDGLSLDGINLGGPLPYQITDGVDGQLQVRALGVGAETLLDLWRMHFARGLRPRTLAA